MIGPDTDSKNLLSGKHRRLTMQGTVKNWRKKRGKKIRIFQVLISEK